MQQHHKTENTGNNQKLLSRRIDEYEQQRLLEMFGEDDVHQNFSCSEIMFTMRNNNTLNSDFLIIHKR